MAFMGIVGAIGAIISAYATFASMQAQAGAQSYAAKVARNNALQARQAAQIAAENAHEKNQRILGAQRARLGASGVMPSEGSPLIVQMDSAEQAALEEARIRYGGQVMAQGYESERALKSYQARISRRGAVVGAGATLLGGVGRSYAAYRGTQPGVNDQLEV